MIRHARMALTSAYATSGVSSRHAPPFPLIFGTGQPMFRSTADAPNHETARRAPSARMSGSAPYSCTTRSCSPGYGRPIVRSGPSLPSTRPRALIISDTVHSAPCSADNRRMGASEYPAIGARTAPGRASLRA